MAHVMTLHVRMFPPLWRLLWPVRYYLRKSPLSRGKGALTRWLVRPLVPRLPASFETTLPGGATVRLYYREVIGLATLLNGSFEHDEVVLARSHAAPGTTAIDVGANVGVFAIPLALAVGQKGHVIAVEPSPQNVARLRAHARENNVGNVEVLACAAGASPGRRLLYLAPDPAFHSTTPPPADATVREAVEVGVTTLDDIWYERDRPDVSFLKVDVEGAELDVLRGGTRLLEACSPTILVESNVGRDALAVSSFLAEFGYIGVDVPGLEPWNYVFRKSV